MGNLPLVIVATLARSSASILGGVDPDKATKLAISYVVMVRAVSGQIQIQILRCPAPAAHVVRLCWPR